MQLVIEIPEENYKNRTLINYFGCYSTELDKIIYEGKPLPKGLENLIDANKLSYKCMHEHSSECNHRMCDTCQFYCVAKYEIDDAPTIIEADGGGQDES